jgi:Ca-activated chloride channel family protein
MKKYAGKIICALMILTILNLPIISSAADNKDAKSDQNSDNPVLHINTRLVTLTITVVDKQGRAISGLDKNDFEIYDDKVKQNVEFFSPQDAPISAALVFDASGSMKKLLDQSIISLREFISARADKDEFCLITFSDRAKLSFDFTHNPETLANSLASAQTDGRTALYDAVYLGLEKIREGRQAKKVLLIISDGQDNNSRYSLNEVKQLARESNALIYAIGVVENPTNAPDDANAMGRWVLEDLAGISGGKAYFPTSQSQLEDAVRKIMLELRQQYSIGFTPGSGDGKWHKLNVKLNSQINRGNISARSRQGYFANFAQ